MKLRVLAAALGAALALHPSQGHAQISADSIRALLARSGSMRNPNPRNGPSTGVSLGFSGNGTTFGYPHVVALSPGGSGERAGLMVGDSIISVNGRDGRQVPVFPNRTPGARYVVRVRRGGEEREVVLVLPSTQPAPPQ